MEMSKQNTLKGSFALCGKGLHTGLNLTITFNPAAVNTGYKIQRIDLEGQPVIDAIAENVVDTQRGTVIGKGDVKVSTVEHALAALYGALRNFFSRTSFTANALVALLILIPVLAAIFYFVRVSSFHSPEMIDPEEFIEAKHLIPALLLLFPAVWTMGSIATALSTRLELVSNLTVCSVIFLLGLVSKYFVTQWLGTGLLADFVRTLLPNWQYFWMADALASRQIIPFSYLLWALVYVFFYIGFWTLWAMALFNEREIARDSR